MKIDVIISPQEYNPQQYAGGIAVVVDVLRATSSMVTAIHNGCAEIIPVVTIEEARIASEGFPKGQVLLAGERNALMIDGFDLGNSPREFIPEKVYDKIIIMTTTNGTKAFLQTHEADETVVLSFLNLRAVIVYLLATRKDIYVLCAGRDGSAALEDIVCAGMLAERLVALHPFNIHAENRAVEAMKLAHQHKNDLLTMMRLSEHGAHLEKIGFAADLEVCARLNSLNILPTYLNGSIQKFNMKQ